MVNEPTRLRITARKSVDKPNMTARVPTIDKRSFQSSIKYTEVLDEMMAAYICYDMKKLFFAIV